MGWLIDNASTLLLLVVFLLLTFRGPLMSRYFKVRQWTVHDLAKSLGEADPPLLVDVRSQGEYNQRHIRQALLAPLHELKQAAPAWREKHAQRPVAVICRSGSRSLMGAVTLRRLGFAQVYNVVGGMAHWESQGYPTKP
ncbi:MAG: rhodanese-like domain-containing protein [Magnetococcus sp. WYHC-3]